MTLTRSMIDLRDIHTLTEFQRNAKKYAKKMTQTGRPLVLTVNGKPGLVVQDAEAYQALIERIEHLNLLQDLRQASREHSEGKSIPWETAKSQLRKELGIQGRTLKKGSRANKSGARMDGAAILLERRRRVG